MNIRKFYSLTMILGCLLQGAAVNAATTPEQVKDFVHAVYIEGVPYEEAAQLDPEVALPILKDVLNDSSEEEYWPNAAVTVGMIGDDRGADLLLDFINRKEPKAKLSRPNTVAKNSAVMALGYIVNKTGNRKALDFLKARVDPKAWTKLPWVGAFQRTKEERDKQLATMAVLGLGLSGNPEARERLKSLKETPKTPQMRELRSALPDVGTSAEEALKAHGIISEKGLTNYYLQYRPKHSNEERTEMGPTSEMEMVKPPVMGEVLKEPQPGEVLKEPQPGEVVAPPKTGRMIRPLKKGEVIKPD
jgi:HEAT repeat protein